MKKSYIDYEKEVRECLDCHRILPFKHFHLIHSYRPQSYCKTCNNKRAKKNVLEKKLKAFPTIYTDCELCGEIYKNRLGHHCKGDE